MCTNRNKLYARKCLVAWPEPVPSTIQGLVTMIFRNELKMVQYACRVVTQTDAFHLIIPLDCFENLSQDPVYQFPQVIKIDVICDNTNYVRWAKRRFLSECFKVNFCTIDDLLLEFEFNHTLASSNPVERRILSDILSLIQARIAFKRLNISSRRSQIRKQSASTLLYACPVRNIVNFVSDVICSSCKLVCQQVYQLECKHQHCQICISTQK